VKKIEFRSYAKVNLILNVLSKCEDGYHNIESIMQSISLSDKVTISERKSGINISCNHDLVPTDFESLAYRAAEKILIECDGDQGVNIKIDKEIPLASGLAGGSTNAASILTGINKLYNLGINSGKLREIGGELGMDIPFFIQNGTALAYHKGEKIAHFESINPPLWLVIVNPGFEVSTHWAYQNLDVKKNNLKKDRINKMILALKNGNPELIAENLYNSFEELMNEKFPETEDLKNDLIKAGALGALMSGSGPTIFGIAKNKNDAFNIVERMKFSSKFIRIVHTI